MKQIIHFNSSKERLNYLRGGFEEIVSKEIKEEPKEEKPKKSKYCG